MNPVQAWVPFLCPLYHIRFDSNRISRGREQSAQAVERPHLHRWQDVGVGVEGQRDLAVPQQLVDDLGPRLSRSCVPCGRNRRQRLLGDIIVWNKRTANRALIP